MPDNLPKGSSAKAMLQRGDQLGGHASSKHMDLPKSDLHKGFASSGPKATTMSKFAVKVDQHKAVAMVRASPEFRKVNADLRKGGVGSSASIRIKTDSGTAPRTQFVNKSDPKDTPPRVAATTSIFAKIIKSKAGLMFQTVVPEPAPEGGAPGKKPGIIQMKIV